MINCEKLTEIIQAIAHRMQQEKEYLTELDNVIGDSDHGINLARGFGEVLKKLEGAPIPADAGALLKTVGMTLVSTVGGASGPLYGTAFMKAGAAVAGKSELAGGDLTAMLAAAIEGIQTRGKSTEGEKTMLDSLCPAARAYGDVLQTSGGQAKEALEQAVQAAWAGVEYTKSIIATKGRASYLGERSLGHQDPGATSVTMLLEAVWETL